MNWKKKLLICGIAASTIITPPILLHRQISKAIHFFKEPIVSDYDDDYFSLEMLSKGVINSDDPEGNMLCEQKLKQTLFESDAGAIGMTQVTPGAINQIMWQWFLYGSTKDKLNDEEKMTYKIIDFFVGQYLKSIPRKSFKKEFYYEKSKNKKPLINNVIDKIKNNSDVNHHFGLAVWTYYDLLAKQTCRKYNVKYSPRVTAAMYNAGPTAIEGFIRNYRNNWDNHLCEETKGHLFRFFWYKVKLKTERETEEAIISLDDLLGHPDTQRYAKQDNQKLTQRL